MQRIPIFVINLERSADRREFMQRQAEQYGLSLEFIPAIDAKNLTTTQLGYYDDALRQSSGWFPHPLKQSEIACALSHMQIWEKIWKDNIEQAIIFEDDLIITPDLAHVILQNNDYAVNHELIYYYHGKTKHWPAFRSVYKNHKLHRVQKQSKHSKRSIIDACAYRLKRTGAIKLLQSAYPILMPLDIYLGHQNIHHVKTYAFEPVLGMANVDNHLFASTIGERPD